VIKFPNVTPQITVSAILWQSAYPLSLGFQFRWE
jgi:hypothetical protein